MNEMPDAVQNVQLGIGELSFNRALRVERGDVVPVGDDEQNRRVDLGGIVRNRRRRRDGERRNE